MAVLSFRKFLDSRVETPRDWSQNEIGEFLRAHNLLSQNGVSIGIDRGVSDIGEPWLVFFDSQSQDVFLHVARISGRCVLVSEPLELRLWASDVTELMQRFDDAVRGFIKERDEHNNKVVLHPAARMIMAISAVFLLFKLDSNSNVYAKDDLQNAAESANRKFESSVMMRVQSAMARMLEAAETPAALAAVAGVLLANEILKHTAVEFVPEDHQNLTPADTALVAHETAEIATVAESVPAPVEVDDVAVPAPMAGAAPAMLAISLVQVAAELVQEAVAAFDSGAHYVAAAAVPAVTAVPVDAKPVATVAATAATEPTQVAHTSLSAAVIQKMVNISWNGTGVVHVMSVSEVSDGAVAAGSDLPIKLDLDETIDWQAGVTPDLPNAPPIEFVPYVASALTIDMLPELTSHVGFYAETHASGAALAEVLAHFMRMFQTLEVEYDGGNVMLEQTNLGGSELSDLGIWRNVMDDGSVISVVGLVGLVDDIPRLL